MPLPQAAMLLRSDTVSLRLEAKLAGPILERLIPLLRRGASLEEMEEVSRVPRANVATVIHKLMVWGVVLSSSPSGPGSDAPLPVVDLFTRYDLQEADIRERLSSARVVLVGAQGHGAHLAALLVQSGLRQLTLIDPFPLEPGEACLFAPLAEGPAGSTRQEALAAVLRRQDPRVTIDLPCEAISFAGIEQASRGADLIVAAMDHGHLAAHYWVNRASMALDIPALFTEVRGAIGRVGPLVRPGHTSCFVCYRMRSVAGEGNFADAMAFEEFLVRTERPALQQQATHPAALAMTASIAAAEVIKSLLDVKIPLLHDQVIAMDSLSYETTRHTILRRPACPACRRRETRPSDRMASPTGRGESPPPPVDWQRIESQLVSRDVGIVRRLYACRRDDSEPLLPALYAAELANHVFAARDDLEGAWGKGLTDATAWISALGEAVERYASVCFEPHLVPEARWSELEGPALHPADLVLFAPSQYAQLPFEPYRESWSLPWVRCDSLLENRQVHVPAGAVFMDFPARDRRRILYHNNSNGVACGSTLVDATLSALCEVLERDAFMITWLNRLPCERIAIASHPDPRIVALEEAYRRRGVSLHLWRLPVDHPCHVFAAAAIDPDNRDAPAAVFGLGADLDISAAASRALIEVFQIRPGLRGKLRDRKVRRRLADLLRDPHRVRELHDHDLLYASPRSLARLQFLLDAPPSAIEWTASNATTAEQLDILLQHFRAKGQEVLRYALTPPDIRSVGLHVVRVLVPGYQPIDFGWRERRLGGERLYRLPVDLGLRQQRLSWQELNDDPHPLS